MTELKNPYKIQPPRKLVREEQKLIQLRDDSAKPPTSIGTDSFQGFMFGAPSMQPSNSSTEVEPSTAKVILRAFFYLWAAAIVVAFLFRIAK